MRVLICGAGQVGFNIAKYLSHEDNDITVLDQSAELIQNINENLDVRAVHGHASHPDMLEKAGAKNADMLIAVTHSDEVNMIASQISHSIFQVPTKIARIRAQNYLQPYWRNIFAENHIPIDHIISPEKEVASAISERLYVPGAFDIIPLADGRVVAVGVECAAGSPIANTPLKQLSSMFIDLDFMVLGITRGDRHFIPQGDDEIMQCDQVYCMAKTTEVSKVLSVFGHEEPEAHRIVLAGGGNIGVFLGQDLQENHEDVQLKVIEHNLARAEFVADNLPEATVLHGDALNKEILAEAGIANTESFVAVTDNDEVNILSALLAKKAGCEKSVALVNSGSYESLISSLGIDTVVNPRSITVSKILQYVRRGRIHSVHSLGEDFGELIEADVPEGCPIASKIIRDVNLPEGARVGALVRDNQVYIPHGTTEIMAHDRIIIFAANDTVQKVEAMLCKTIAGF